MSDWPSSPKGVVCVEIARMTESSSSSRWEIYVVKSGEQLLLGGVFRLLHSCDADVVVLSKFGDFLRELCLS